MDETSLSTPPTIEHRAPPHNSHADRRRRAHEILSTQHSRLDRLEGELTDRIGQLADQLAQELAATGGDQAAIVDAAHDARLTSLAEQVDTLRADLAARDEALSRAMSELEQARIERGRMEQELHVSGTLVHEANSRDERTRVEWATLSEQLTDTRAQLDAAHTRQEELRSEVSTLHKEVADQQDRAKSQRRRIAREFKSRHAAQATQLDEQQTEIARLQEALAQANAEQDRLVGELRESAGPHADEVEELHKLRNERDSLIQRLAATGEQLADHQARLAAAGERLGESERLAAELEQARIEAGKLEHELRVRDALVGDAQGQAERARVESAAIGEQLADAQSRLTASGERLAEFERMTSQLEQARLEAGRLQQDLQVRNAELAEARARDEARRVELATTAERLSDVEAQLAAAGERQEEFGREAAAQNEAFATERARLTGELHEMAAARDAETQELTTLRGEREGVAQRLADAEERLAAFDATKAELKQARDEAAGLTQEVHARDEQLAEVQGREEMLRRELAEAAERLNNERAQLAAAQGELAAAAERAEALKAAMTQLEQARVEVGKLEQELRVREALLAEAQGQQESSRVETASAIERLNDAQAQLVIARQRQEELRHEAAAAQAAAEAAQATGATNRDAELARLRDALKTAQAESERLSEQLQEVTASAGDDSAELKMARKERDALKKKLAVAEEKLEQAADRAESLDEDGLQRRFEMAVEELRELKRTNAELETKLKSRGAVALPGAVGGGMDWESQKLRMLASLEEDDRPDLDEDEAAERQTVEGTIRITDQIVAQKDGEIDQLRKQLEELGSGSSATATVELLDRDEIIQRERENLLQAQAEWREKIGKAEIDISVERAKIARERMELEEKLRTYQDDQENRSNDGTADAPGKPARGRWLARLGLKDLNEE